MNIYDIPLKNADQLEVNLAPYQNKVMLIVNTATGCGFTPQYEGLEKLYKTYKDQGFVVLDFPCNQFGKQAPGTVEDINAFCTLNYGTTFPRFAKIEVNGANEAPLYTYLKKAKGSFLGAQIKWNFTKFLVDKEGNVVKRYESNVVPANIEKDILTYLSK